MIIAYWLAVAMTFILVMNAFLKDNSVSNTDPMAWFFILTATLLSPITLPFILRAKLQAMQASHLSKTSKAPEASKATEGKAAEPRSLDLLAKSSSDPVLTGVSATQTGNKV